MKGRIKPLYLTSGIVLGAILVFTAGCAPTIGSLEPQAEETVPAASSPSPVEENPMPEEETPPDAEQNAPATELPDRELRATLAATPNLEQVPADPASNAVVGEVPDGLLQDILADVGERAGRSVDSYTLLRAESVVWSDGSLGCPQLGQMYTQALVEGYWVVIEFDGQVHDYRTSGERSFTLCPDGQPLAPPPTSGTPTS